LKSAVIQTPPTANLHVIEMEIFLNDGLGFLFQLLFRECSFWRAHWGQRGFPLHCGRTQITDTLEFWFS
jgi:hypothetical protein